MKTEKLPPSALLVGGRWRKKVNGVYRWAALRRGARDKNARLHWETWVSAEAQSGARATVTEENFVVRPTVFIGEPRGLA